MSGVLEASTRSDNRFLGAAWDCPVDADLNICALQKWCDNQDDLEDDVGDYIDENETEDQDLDKL